MPVAAEWMGARARLRMIMMASCSVVEKLPEERQDHRMELDVRRQQRSRGCLSVQGRSIEELRHQSMGGETNDEVDSYFAYRLCR